MLFGAAVYLLFSLTVQSDDELTRRTVTVTAWMTLVLGVTVLAVVDSVRNIRLHRTRELAIRAFVVKLAAIPFFVLNAYIVFMLVVIGVSIFFEGGVVLSVFVAIGAALAYLVMLSTSVYGWASVIQLRRDRHINPGLVVLYCIMLLVPVLDTVAGILLFVHARRGAKAAAGAAIAAG